MTVETDVTVIVAAVGQIPDADPPRGALVPIEEAEDGARDVEDVAAVATAVAAGTPVFALGGACCRRYSEGQAIDESS